MFVPASKNWFTNKLLEEKSSLNLEIPRLAPVFSTYFFPSFTQSSGDSFTEAGKVKLWGQHLSVISHPSIPELVKEPL